MVFIRLRGMNPQAILIFEMLEGIEADSPHQMILQIH